MDPIYLDNNATTQVAPEVFEAMRPYLESTYGNASSLHQFGAQASEALDEARRRVANLVGASPSEIVFTSGGTESNNLAIQSTLAAKDDKNHIIISSVEHPSIMDLCEHLEKRRGVTSSRVSPPILLLGIFTMKLAFLFLNLFSTFSKIIFGLISYTPLTSAILDILLIYFPHQYFDKKYYG